MHESDPVDESTEHHPMPVKVNLRKLKSVFGQHKSLESAMATPFTFSARQHANKKAGKLAKETGEYVEVMLFRGIGRYVLVQGEKIYCRDNKWRTEEEALEEMGLGDKE